MNAPTSTRHFPFTGPASIAPVSLDRGSQTSSTGGFVTAALAFAAALAAGAGAAAVDRPPVLAVVFAGLGALHLWRAIRDGA